MLATNVTDRNKISSQSDLVNIDVYLGVDVCRPPSGGDTGDHVDGEEGRTGSLVDEGQGAHRVLVEDVSQARMVAEKTAHPGLADSTLPDIEVAQLLTPAGEIL